MTTTPLPPRIAGLAAAAALAALAAASPARAGSCPTDKIVADSGMESSAEAAGVTDTVIASIDLATEAPKLDGRQFRLRRLEIEPGGIVPWHSHAERPAVIYIVSGEILEHSSTCAVPILHRAGETSVETHETSHWWKNEGTETVVLLSADIFPGDMNPNQM